MQWIPDDRRIIASLATYAPIVLQLENSRRIEMSLFEVRGPSSHMGVGCSGLLLEYAILVTEPRWLLTCTGSIGSCFHVKREPYKRRCPLSARFSTS